MEEALKPLPKVELLFIFPLSFLFPGAFLFVCLFFLLFSFKHLTLFFISLFLEPCQIRGISIFFDVTAMAFTTGKTSPGCLPVTECFNFFVPIFPCLFHHVLFFLVHKATGFVVFSG